MTNLLDKKFFGVIVFSTGQYKIFGQFVMKKINLTGQVFGNWTVLRQDLSLLPKNGTKWICRCVCGTERSVNGQSLKREASTCCGCIRPNSFVDGLDLIGQQFGRLTIISLASPIKDDDGKNRTAYLCSCACGTELIVSRHQLQGKNGNKSCGCLKVEASSKAGLSKRIHEPKIATARVIFKNGYDDGNLSFEQFYELSQQLCFYCGIPPATIYNKYIHRGDSKVSKYAIENGDFIYNGLDRVDNSLPHDFDNVVPCCPNCNWAKSNYSQDTFYKWICAVYENWAKKYDI
jgi:hypothetical protein